MANLRTFRRKLRVVRGRIIMASLLLRDAIRRGQDMTDDGRSVFKSKKANGRRCQFQGWFRRWPMPF